MSNKKIVTIGGGSGQYILLSGLRDIENIDITAIVSMVDSGGSTGRLRDEYGVLPPGDILKCILALSQNRNAAREILQKRFNSGSKLDGHSVGNMLLTMLSQYSGSFPEGVNALGEALGIKGKVLPVTTDKATLVAELTDGSRLYGETVIDIPRGDQREKIKNTFLVPHHNEEIKVYEPAINAIKQADYIIIGPGDLYTSITPNFLVKGMKEALHDSLGKIVYIVNIMTKFGETDNFSGKDFVINLEDFIGKKVDTAVYNSGQPDAKVLEEYKKQKAYLVDPDVENDWGEREIIKEDMINIAGDIARHDFSKLANLINKLL